MYKAFINVDGSNYSEFRINPKYALSTTFLGSEFIFDRNHIVQTFYSKFFFFIIMKDNVNIHFIDKSSRHEQDSWLLNSLHNLFYHRYPIHMIDFIIVDPNEKKSKLE